MWFFLENNYQNYSFFLTLKQVDPDNEYLVEEIESLKRPVLKELITKLGGTQDDITGKSKTELRAIARDLHLKKA